MSDSMKITNSGKIDTHRALQVIFTTLDVFKKRGYQVPDQLEMLFDIPHRKFIYHEETEELSKGLTQYMKTYDEYGIKINYKSVWEFRFTAIKKNKEIDPITREEKEVETPVFFSFLTPSEIGKSDKINTNTIRFFSDHYSRLLNNGPEPHLFICLLGKLIGMAKTSFNKIRKSSKKIETFMIDFLLFNPLRHVMNGESRILTQKEIDKISEKIIGSSRIKSKLECFPTIDESDIVSKFLGVDSGVIKFIRPNFKTSLVNSVYYRRVNAIKNIKENLRRTEKYQKEKKFDKERVEAEELNFE
jgi:hypothetical protein